MASMATLALRGDMEVRSAGIESWQRQPAHSGNLGKAPCSLDLASPCCLYNVEVVLDEWCAKLWEPGALSFNDVFCRRPVFKQLNPTSIC